MLKAVLIVCDGNMGHRDGSQLVFHYPPCPVLLSHEVPGQSAVDNLRASLSSPGTSISSPDRARGRSPSTQAGMSGGAAEQLNGADGLIFGHTPGFLAKLLTPKAGLCGDILEVCVDGLRYVCLPTLFGGDDRPASTGTDTEDSDDDDDITWGDVQIRNAWQPSGQASAAAFSPGDDRNERNEATDTPRLSMFNLVLVVTDHTHNAHGHKGLQNQNHDRHNASFYKACREMVQRLTSVLVSEESRVAYISDQVSRMLRIRDTISSRSNNHEPTESSADLRLLTRHQLQSPMAGMLKDMFDAVNERGTALLHINSFVSVHVGFPDHPSTTNSPSLDVPHLPHHLRPYHTLMLLCPESVLLRMLPPGSSPLLPQLIAVSHLAMGYKTFRELHFETGIEMSQLYECACHLVHWRKAIVIQTLNKNSMYVVKPSLPSVTISSPLELAFSQAFPSSPMSLAAVLANFFKVPVRLSQLQLRLDDTFDKRRARELVPWLLSHRLVDEVHLYVHYLPHAPSQISVPHGLHSQADKDYRKLVVLFNKLKPYLNGRHHLDNIMFESGVTREDILRVVNHFNSVLVTSLCPWFPID